MATYEYPLKKSKDKDDWVKINIKKYIPGTFGGGDFGAPGAATGGSTIHTILLPMPYNLPQNGTVANWDSSTLNPLESALGGAAQSFISGGLAGLGDYAKNAATSLQESATSGTVVKGAEVGFTAAAIKAITGGGSQGNATLSRFAGVTFNENVELAFAGVTLRPTFNLQFKLTPREKKESNMIKEMVRQLKINMAPKKNAIGANTAILLGVPNVFEVEYMRGTQPHPYLNTFKLCALKGLSLDLSTDGYATYHDATPVAMTLTLTFQELTPIYQEDYTEEAKGKQGIGY